MIGSTGRRPGHRLLGLLLRVVVGLSALALLTPLAFDFVSTDLAVAASRQDAVDGAVEMMGVAWPGTDIRVREADSSAAVERFWLGMLESRMRIEQRGGDWFILPGLESGPATMIKIILILLAAAIVGYLAPIPLLRRLR